MEQSFSEIDEVISNMIINIKKDINDSQFKKLFNFFKNKGEINDFTYRKLDQVINESINIFDLNLNNCFFLLSLISEIFAKLTTKTRDAIYVWLKSCLLSSISNKTFFRMNHFIKFTDILILFINSLSYDEKKFLFDCFCVYVGEIIKNKNLEVYLSKVVDVLHHILILDVSFVAQTNFISNLEIMLSKIYANDVLEKLIKIYVLLYDSYTSILTFMDKVIYHYRTTGMNSIIESVSKMLCKLPYEIQVEIIPLLLNHASRITSMTYYLLSCLCSAINSETSEYIYDNFIKYNFLDSSQVSLYKFILRIFQINIDYTIKNIPNERLVTLIETCLEFDDDYSRIIALQYVDYFKKKQMTISLDYSIILEYANSEEGGPISEIARSILS